jgi:hydrogenase maturation protease
VNLNRVEKIAEAVLYEGYMLYPYRPSSVKNQQRWNFGVLYPPSWCSHQSGADRSSMQTECLLKTDGSTRLTIKVRFLHIVQRSIAKVVSPSSEPFAYAKPDLDPVDRLELAGRVYQPWQEAVERELSYDDLDPADFATMSPLLFSFFEGEDIDYLRNEQGVAVGAIIREWNALNGSVEIRSLNCHDDVVRIAVQVENLTGSDPPIPFESESRETALSHSLVSAHTILGADNGEFLSLLEPPAGFEEDVTHCQNLGTWPVLATDNADAMLSSPIILYDHPQIAPESAGNLFDSTEIDEILSLRILTLTEDEKREMRQSDDRTRGILERTEGMPQEQFMKLHGALRGLTPSKEEMQ